MIQAMVRRSLILLFVALIVVQAATGQNSIPLEQAKHLVEEMYPQLRSGVLHATYTLEQDNFSTAGVPLQMQLRVEEYCHAKPDSKTGALPVAHDYPCAAVNPSYKPELQIGFFFMRTQRGVILRGFYTDGTIFQGRTTWGSDSSVPFRYGPDKKDQVIAKLPMQALEKLLRTRLAVTEASFNSKRNIWLVTLKGNGKFLLTVEPVAGLPTNFQTLEGAILKARSPQ